MKEKTKTDPFNTGHYTEEEEPESVDKITNRSRMKSANKMHSGAGYDRPDGLRNALSASKSMYQATHKAHLPTDNLRWTHSHTPQSRGAHYTPAGSFGRTERTGAGRGVYSYGGNMHSARSSNAVPGNQNSRSGGNAVGHVPNRRGTNALPGREINGHGHNAVGNPPNRTGENALASRFVPRGGFHGGARRA